MIITNSAFEHYFESFQPRADTPRFSLFVFKVMLTVNLWRRLSKTRKALKNMSDAQLCDIGLTRFEAEIEAARKFYDI